MEISISIILLTSSIKIWNNSSQAHINPFSTPQMKRVHNNLIKEISHSNISIRKQSSCYPIESTTQQRKKQLYCKFYHLYCSICLKVPFWNSTPQKHPTPISTAITKDTSTSGSPSSLHNRPKKNTWKPLKHSDKDSNLCYKNRDNFSNYFLLWSEIKYLINLLRNVCFILKITTIRIKDKPSLNLLLRRYWVKRVLVLYLMWLHLSIVLLMLFRTSEELQKRKCILKPYWEIYHQKRQLHCSQGNPQPQHHRQGKL